MVTWSSTEMFIERNNTTSPLGQGKDDGRLGNIVEGIFILTLAALAVIGNSIIIYAIYSNRNLRALRNLFIASLSLSDFLMACTDMLYQAIGKLIPEYRPPHSSICYFILLTGVLFGSASVFNLTAMTINRYIAISYPLHYSTYVTQRRSGIILLGIWLAALCMAFPPLVWRPEDVVCHSTTPSDNHLIYEIIYMTAEWVFWFVIPGFVISFSYYKIYRIAKNQARQIAAMEISHPCTGTEGVNATVRMTTYKEKKAGRMVAILIGFWSFCWLPFFTVLTIHKFLPSGVPPILMRVFLGLMFVNSAANPVILTLHNREMKSALRNLFSKSRQPNRFPVTDFEMTSARRMTFISSE